jgi:hypothetical protein
MNIDDVPEVWASGDKIPEPDRLKIALLRIAGCTCELPLIRHSHDGSGYNAGPRCKVCNTQVILAEPTPEMIKRRQRNQHLANKEILEIMPDIKDNEWFAGIGDCYEGCGCR